MKLPLLSLILIFLNAPLPAQPPAQTHRVFLGELDLVGPVPRSWSTDLTRLSLNVQELTVTGAEGTVLGGIPGPFHGALHRMIRNGLHLQPELTHRYLLPRPNQHLRISLWADTKDLSLIEPLIYHIPIHSKEDLEDYE